MSEKIAKTIITTLLFVVLVALAFGWPGVIALATGFTIGAIAALL